MVLSKNLDGSSDINLKNQEALLPAMQLLQNNL
jgi:hypothetical protein